jgi:hypothetical protein
VLEGTTFPGEWPDREYRGMAEDFEVGPDDTVGHWGVWPSSMKGPLLSLGRQ